MRNEKNLLENWNSQLIDFILTNSLEEKSPTGYDGYKKKVAIKKFSEMSQKRSQDAFTREAFIFCVLDLHLGKNRVPEFYGFSNHDKYFIAMEYVSDSLHLMLHKGTKFSLPQQLKIAMHLAETLNYLHTLKILHRDIKSGNILMKNGKIPLLSDFGSAVYSPEMTARFKGTRPWQAPETWRHSNGYTEKSEVYSFGLLLWELITGEIPFNDLLSYINTLVGFKKIIKENYRPSIPSDIPEDYRELIELCWDGDETKRPTFPTILDKLRKIIGGKDKNSSSKPYSTSAPECLEKCQDTESMKKFLRQQTICHWGPPFNWFKQRKRINRGASTVVYNISFKIMLKKCGENESIIYEARNALTPKYLVKIYGLTSQHNKDYFVIEHCPYLLSEMLGDEKELPLPWNKRLKILKIIAKEIDNLIKVGSVLVKIRSSSIFLTENFIPKILPKKAYSNKIDIYNDFPKLMREIIHWRKTEQSNLEVFGKIPLCYERIFQDCLPEKNPLGFSTIIERLNDISHYLKNKENLAKKNKQKLNSEIKNKFREIEFVKKFKREYCYQDIKREDLEAKKRFHSKIDKNSKQWVSIPISNSSFGKITKTDRVGEPKRFGLFKTGYEYNNQPVTVKKIGESPRTLYSFFDIPNLNHPSLLKFYAVAMKKVYYLVTEHCISTLHQLLIENEVSLPWSKRIKMAIEIAEGIKCLLKNNFSLQITDSNILITEQLIPKIDVHESVFSPHDMDFRSRRNYWTAPELLYNCKPTEKPSEASTIYNFGILLWQFATRKIPYDSLDIGSFYLLEKICSQNHRPKLPDQVPDDFKELIKSCWQQDPSKRPTISTVVKQLKKHAISANLCNLGIFKKKNKNMQKTASVDAQKECRFSRCG